MKDKLGAVDYKSSDWVLWQDKTLLVINKPAGLPSLPDGYDPDAPCLVGLLKQVFAPLWVVHRLDRNTSGVMIFARTSNAHRVMNSQFEQRQVSKIYHALIKGSPTWVQKTVELPLLPDGDRKHRTVVDHKKGKTASTNLTILEQLGVFTLILASPHTGRRHQIRAHLAAVGFPIVSDLLYGGHPGVRLSDFKTGYHKKDSGETRILNRLGLHAHDIMIKHPATGEKIQFEAPYPNDLAMTLKQLRKHSS